MAASLIIKINSPLTSAQIQRAIRSTTDARGQCERLKHLFTRLECGASAANFSVQTAAAATAAAKQTITLTYASIANADTVTIAGVVLTCVTGTPAGVQFKKVTDATVTAANLVALINATATLNIYGWAANVAGVVTFTAHEAGLAGNFITVATSNATGFGLGAATLAGGTGGAQTKAISCSRGY